MKYGHVYTEVFRKPWAILPEKFNTIAEIVTLRAMGEKMTEEEIRERLNAASHPEAAAASRNGKNYGTVALIPVYGVISQRMNLMTQISGGTSIEKLTSQLRTALSDTNVSAIVMDVDSPGGGVEGVPELADEILAGRSQKKIIAVANGMAASAAYWLACCATELVVAPSGQVGSIGVFAAHEDMSKALEQEGVKVSLVSAGKFKTEGNPYEPLTDEARAALQAKVDEFYGMFVKSVAKGRKVSQESVRSGYGEGRMLLAGAAVKEGMADRIATLDDVLGKLGVKAATPAAVAENASPAVAALRRRGRELDLH
ncbi:MAG TPA: S49 family peptidase [Bryobacteraceae bacterium]|nr:S49 family peptidase [Bryobacteraceae bacterium]